MTKASEFTTRLQVAAIGIVTGGWWAAGAIYLFGFAPTLALLCPCMVALAAWSFASARQDEAEATDDAIQDQMIFPFTSSPCGGARGVSAGAASGADALQRGCGAGHPIQRPRLIRCQD